MFQRVVVYTEGCSEGGVYDTSAWHDSSTDYFDVETLLGETMQSVAEQRFYIDGPARWKRSLDPTETYLEPVSVMEGSGFIDSDEAEDLTYIFAWVQQEEVANEKDLPDSAHLTEQHPEICQQLDDSFLSSVYAFDKETKRASELFEMLEYSTIKEGTTTFVGIEKQILRQYGLRDYPDLDQADADKIINEVSSLPPYEDDVLFSLTTSLSENRHLLQPGVVRKVKEASLSSLRASWVCDDRRDVFGLPNLNVLSPENMEERLFCSHIGKRSRKRCQMRKGHKGPHRY